MAYTPFQDGTQVFGIPDSPVSINSVAFIAEDIQISKPSQVVEIKDPNGIATGQVIIPQNLTGSCKLQLADDSVSPPEIGQTFDLQGATWYVTEVGQSYTQAAYAFVNVSFRLQINA
jgi:hypothetical protein